MKKEKLQNIGKGTWRIIDTGDKIYFLCLQQTSKQRKV